jgi:murein DD-endopeptidase MepM/ murein hydrolase activator NlpD
MRSFLASLVFLSVLTACTGKADLVTPPPSLIPYQTTTPAETATILPVLTSIILPTPTTFTYSIVAGDTLIAIAERFGITLEALIAANPGIQPSALLVGDSLVIPTGSSNPAEPTPSPAPLRIQQARCWPQSDGGLWCFALIQNEYAQAVENLSAQFTLLDLDGQEIASQAAFAMLNTLPSGSSMPLAVHFPAPMPVDPAVRVQVLTAIRLLPGDARYLPAATDNTLLRIDPSGRTAQVTGRVLLTGPGTASSTWVLAVVYDETGNVVGLRRWESQSPLSVDSPLSFDFSVYSLGPGIARVEFLVEARP